MVFQETNFVAFSTAEAENVATGACCAQVFWMKQTLLIIIYILTILKYFMIILVPFI